jgi:hypothetical protein
MIAVAVVAGLLASLLSPTALIVAFGLFYLALIGALWWMFRGFRRVSAFCFGVAAALTNASSAALDVYPPDMGYDAIPMFLGWFLALPIVISTGAAWAGAATRRTARPRRSPWLAWPLVLALGILPLTMLVTHWPLRLAFLVSRPAMNRLADRVLAGQAVISPEWAGLFRVVGSAVDPTRGNVGLIIDANPSGRSGFVRVGAGVRVPAGRSVAPFYNLSFDLPLCDRWWYACED